MLNIIKTSIRRVLERQEVDFYESSLFNGYQCVDSIENHKIYFDNQFGVKGIQRGVNIVWNFEGRNNTTEVSVILDGERNTISVHFV